MLTHGHSSLRFLLLFQSPHLRSVGLNIKIDWILGFLGLDPLSHLLLLIGLFLLHLVLLVPGDLVETFVGEPLGIVLSEPLLDPFPVSKFNYRVSLQVVLTIFIQIPLLCRFLIFLLFVHTRVLQEGALREGAVLGNLVGGRNGQGGWALDCVFWLF